jgi:GNAT superfamily N-acetyltransferase
MAIAVRLGTRDEVAAAASVYEQSNLARHGGVWPGRASRVAQVTASLNAPPAWFLLGRDGDEPVAMALAFPFRELRGAGPVRPGTSFLDLIYVAPDRWGEGIGAMTLDAVIAEAARRGAPTIYLGTREQDNERAKRLYRSRGFVPTGTTMALEGSGELSGEWVRKP